MRLDAVQDNLLVFVIFETKYQHILEDFENPSQIFTLFLQAVYAIVKLLVGFNVQPRIGMNQSLI